MRWLLTITLTVLVGLAAAPAAPAAASCAREEFGAIVDRTGAALRQLNADNAPKMRAKMRELKEARGWPDADFEEKAMEAMQDERMAALDRQANDLLAKLDGLGTVDPSREPDCARLQELTATSLELQATVKAKAAYTLAKLDQMIAGPPPPPPPPPKVVEAAPPPLPPQAPAPTAPSASRPPEASSWGARTKSTPQVAIAPPPAAEPQRPGSASPPAPPLAPAPGDEEGYTIDEIMAASAGFFGKVSANLGAVIEHLFKSSGRPKGYVLGTEGGGAFIAGLRYGKGTLYLRSGGATHKVFWHGPSLGTDVGAAGSKTLFLVYRLNQPEDIFATFTGVDGSAYLVGGVGATLVTNGKVILAPIRSGVGLRLGANIGYIRFTPHSTWNPF